MIKHGDKIKLKILNAGLKLWRNDQRSLTVRNLADAVGMTHPGVLYHFKDEHLYDAIAAHAVQKGESRIIVQLIAQGHAAIKDMTSKERKRHASIVGEL